MQKRFSKLIVIISVFVIGEAKAATYGISHHLAKAEGLTQFYALALTKIAANGDSITASDYFNIRTAISDQISPYISSYPTTKLTRELTLLLAELKEFGDNSSRLSEPAAWLSAIAQRLDYASSQIAFVHDRFRIEGGHALTPSQVRWIKKKSSIDAYVLLLAPKFNEFHGSYLTSNPFSHEQQVKNYLVQTLNDHLATDNFGPRLQDPLTKLDVDDNLRQAVTLQFEYRQQVERYVSSL